MYDQEYHLYLIMILKMSEAIFPKKQSLTQQDELVSNYECLERYNDTDFLLESDETVLEKLQQSPKQDSIIFSYNQHADNRTRSACTLFAPLSVVSSMRNVKLTQSELMSCWDYAVKNAGYKE